MSGLLDSDTGLARRSVHPRNACYIHHNDSDCFADRRIHPNTITAYPRDIPLDIAPRHTPILAGKRCCNRHNDPDCWRYPHSAPHKLVDLWGIDNALAHIGDLRCMHSHTTHSAQRPFGYPHKHLNTPLVSHRGKTKHTALPRKTGPPHKPPHMLHSFSYPSGDPHNHLCRFPAPPNTHNGLLRTTGGANKTAHRPHNALHRFADPHSHSRNVRGYRVDILGTRPPHNAPPHHKLFHSPHNALRRSVARHIRPHMPTGDPLGRSPPYTHRQHTDDPMDTPSHTPHNAMYPQQDRHKHPHNRSFRPHNHNAPLHKMHPLHTPSHTPHNAPNCSQDSHTHRRILPHPADKHTPPPRKHDPLHTPNDTDKAAASVPYTQHIPKPPRQEAASNAASHNPSSAQTAYPNHEHTRFRATLYAPSALFAHQRKQPENTNLFRLDASSTSHITQPSKTPVFSPLSQSCALPLQPSTSLLWISTALLTLLLSLATSKAK